ncbi:glycogen/starch/alpha-glucan phosphorylase [Shewanella sp.]|uniref:glycogen/starch/alpha-glucan phosphorylase n=3 Tax=Shewanella sp. TaxID=50422 RepID=UPI004053B556
MAKPRESALKGELKNDLKQSLDHGSKPKADHALEEPCEDCDSLDVSFERHLRYDLSREQSQSGELFNAMARSVKEQMFDLWRKTRLADSQYETKKVSYLSLEFLLGRTLGNALLNLDLTEQCKQALKPHAVSLEELESHEHDAGLGNGGLGRLAACFLDSCASIDLAVTGYGIRYQYGMFVQKMDNGYQVEGPDLWLRDGNPWEVRMVNRIVSVPFFGSTKSYIDKDGKRNFVWQGTQDVLAVPYDMPIAGYRNGRVNTLRLWRAEASDDFDLTEFNEGDYTEAVARKNLAEQITMVLYPNDSSENGKELRLRQQFFLSSASLQDVLNQYTAKHGKDFSQFSSKHVFQLNDTHPSIAIPELMRLLLDVHGLDWDKAWDITRSVMAYTNHTLLPEALERWPVRMLQHMLPRILDIIYEINGRYLERVAHRWPGDANKLRVMSIIEEGDEPQVRMAYLAIVGSFSVNGVAALHSQLLTSTLFNDFYQMWPQLFNNKTNGVSPRRWLMHANPDLSTLITKAIGTSWQRDLTQLTSLNGLTQDKAFIKQWQQVKFDNKAKLAALVAQECEVEFDLSMLFDVQVKRIHEYKRQLLNLLHVVHLYGRILDGDVKDMVPRCVLMGGKAAPGYAMAKLIIKFANNLAHMINSDPRVKPYLRMAYLPNYNVSAMEVICPGTELSEQISTAGKEASGTGNMKFMMNGALTIGTLDGANIEIREQVGPDNFFLFGLSAEQVAQANDTQENQIFSPALLKVIALLKSGHFNLVEPGIFDPIIAAIEAPKDQWRLAADFDSYCQAQLHVANTYLDKETWQQMSIRNTAASGRFSSDVTIGQYRDDIWMAKKTANNNR